MLVKSPNTSSYLLAPEYLTTEILFGKKIRRVKSLSNQTPNVIKSDIPLRPIPIMNIWIVIWITFTPKLIMSLFYNNFETISFLPNFYSVFYFLVLKSKHTFIHFFIHTFMHCTFYSCTEDNRQICLHGVHFAGQARRKGGCTGCTCTLSFLGEKIMKIPPIFHQTWLLYNRAPPDFSTSLRAWNTFPKRF